MHKEKETEREKYRLLGLARMKREEEEKTRQVGKGGRREGGREGEVCTRRTLLGLARMKREEEEKARQVGKEGGREGGRGKFAQGERDRTAAELDAHGAGGGGEGAAGREGRREGGREGGVGSAGK